MTIKEFAKKYKMRHRLSRIPSTSGLVMRCKREFQPLGLAKPIETPIGSYWDIDEKALEIKPPAPGPKVAHRIS